MNIIRSCREFTQTDHVKAFVGGLHFVDCNQTENEVQRFCSDITTNCPDIRIITGHCTGDKAKQMLSQSNLNIEFFHTGSVLHI